MFDMPRPRPPHIQHEKYRHGRRVWIFRRGKGKRVRLPDEYGTLEFWEAYNRALKDQAASPKVVRQRKGTLEWLIGRHMESAYWQGLSSATRRQRSNIYKNVIRNSSNPPFSTIDRLTIQQAMDRRAETPAQANCFLKAMQSLFLWALRNGHVEVNPTIGVQPIKYKSKGFTAWTTADVTQFCHRWPVGTKQRLALELFLVSGLRRGDMHVAGPQHLTGNIFSMRNQKTGTEVTMQFPQSLVNTIRQTETGAFHFITKDNGDPFTSKESFGNWFGSAMP
ncbi:MAG: integrase [Pseudomonadota bacterium]